MTAFSNPFIPIPKSNDPKEPVISTHMYIATACLAGILANPKHLEVMAKTMQSNAAEAYASQAYELATALLSKYGKGS